MPFNQGDALVASVGGKRVEGTVKFATAWFVSIDQGGGLTVVAKLDANANKWMCGKQSVQFIEHRPYVFAERLKEAAKLARKVLAFNDEK